MRFRLTPARGVSCKNGIRRMIRETNQNGKREEEFRLEKVFPFEILFVIIDGFWGYKKILSH